MTLPLVSVIIPVYNIECYLEKCLDSIIRQTYKNIEIVLIDDGSQDNSGKICDDYAGTYDNVSVVHTGNNGLSAARNLGIDNMAGDYVVFVDADDYIAPDMIEILLSTAESTGSDIVICDPVHVFNENEPDFKVRGAKIRIFTPVEAIKEMWYQTSFLPSAWAKIYRIETFKNIRFTEGIIYEDIDVMHEIFWQANQIVYLPEKLYAYVHRENSITTQKFSEQDFYILDVCKKMTDFAKLHGEGLDKAALAYSVTGHMRMYLSTPRTDKYKDIIEKSKNFITKNGKRLLIDKRLRNKSRIGILLFYLSKSLFCNIHLKINRWK